MADPTWYDIFKDFQSIIGTLVGFGGVMYTLHRNARNVAAQKERDIEHERDALINALLAEVTIIDQRMKRDRDALDHQSATENNFLCPRAHKADGLTRVYRDTISKIGLLTPSEANAIASAYSSYEAYADVSAYCEDFQSKAMERTHQLPVHGDSAHRLLSTTIVLTATRITTALQTLQRRQTTRTPPPSETSSQRARHQSTARDNRPIWLR